MDDRDGKKGQQ
jgi:hypothetical protein